MKKNLLLLAAILSIGYVFQMCKENTGSGQSSIEDAPPPPSVVLLKEDFSDTLGTFHNETTAGQGGWKIDYSTACATGYNNTTKETTAGTFYLISPELNLKGVQAAHIAYEYILRYNRKDTNQRLLITSSYNGSAANHLTSWKEVFASHQQTTGFFDFVTVGIDIPAEFLGREHVRIALCYNAEASGCSTWEVRNLQVATGHFEAHSTKKDPIIEPIDIDSASYNKRIEVPALSGGDFVRHIVEVNGTPYMNYCLEYDSQKMHSRWVAFRFDAITRVYNPFITVTTQWQEDEKLSSRLGMASFGNGYVRGRLCTSADRRFSQEANDQTQYLSNVSPQLKDFNQSLWQACGKFVYEHGRNAAFADTLYVVKGGSIADNQIIGYLPRPTGSIVAIPKFYWTALLRVKDNTYDAIGFWMEHKGYSDTCINLADFAVSIDELEMNIGVDLFHNLPDSIETSVEQAYDADVWNL